MIKDKEEQGRRKKDQTNRHGAVDKSSSEQHFRKSTTITLSCEISGALHLAQPGLMAGRQAEIQMNFENFRIHYRLMYLAFRFVQQVYSIIITVPMHSSRVFWIKLIGRLFYEVQK